MAIKIRQSGQWVEVSSSGGSGGSSDPVGTIVAWAGSVSTIPSDYQLCDGGSAQTSALQAITGANVPDLKDRFIVGASDISGTGTYPGVGVGSTGGSANAVLIAHNHSVTTNRQGTTASGGGDTGGADKPETTGIKGIDAAGNSSNSQTGTNANLPPYYALCYIIKHTATSGSGGSVGFDTYVSGATLDSTTKVLTLSRLGNVGDLTVDLSSLSAGGSVGFDTYVSGVSLSGQTLTLSRLGNVGDLTVDLTSAISGIDTYVSGATLDSTTKVLTLSRTGSIGNVTVDLSSLSGGGISDAPNDGKQYGRQSQSWTEITGVGIGSTSKIVQGNTEAEVVDTGSDGHFKVLTEGIERFRIGPTGITTVVGTAKFADNTVTIEKISSTEGVIDSGISGGTLFICGGQPAAGKVKIQGTRSSNHDNIICNAVNSPGSTELHFAATGGTGGKKLETTGYGITVTGISSATEGFDFEVQSGGTPVTTDSVKTLNFSGTNNTITYDASTKTVDIDIDSGSGGGGISDAPNDGKQYGRQSQSWTEITGGGGGTVFSGTFTASAGSPSTLNTYAYDSAELVFEYTVFVKNGSDYQSQKLLVMRDGTTVHSTQYGVMYSNNPLVELDATISGSNLLLRATPETGVNGSTTYRLKRESV